MLSTLGPRVAQEPGRPTVGENETVELMTPAEVAKLFRVDPKTVVRWLHADKLQGIRTPGGHARFRKDSVEALLNDGVQSDGDES